MMNEDEFWALMSETKRASERDAEEQMELITARLEKLSPAEVVAFHNLFQGFQDDAYRWDLWAAAYIINGGCSDDHFNDFRGWLVAQGREVYTASLADPDSLAEVVHLEPYMQVEGFDYIAPEVYEQSTGEEIPLPEGGTVSQDPAGEDWDDDDLPGLLPKLWARFGE